MEGERYGGVGEEMGVDDGGEGLCNSDLEFLGTPRIKGLSAN